MAAGGTGAPARFPGAKVLRTAVGEANVVAALKPSKGLLGGEGNGGVIVPEVCWVRDSLSAMALVLDLIASLKPDERSTLRLRRDKTIIETQVRIGKRPAMRPEQD